MSTLRFFVFFLALHLPFTDYGQDITLYQQFNGRYDYIAIGNTLNLIENGSFATCAILTSSSATLNLSPSQNIAAAYLYWAGSGDGDLDILVNNTPITAERVFNDALDENRVFFSAFADITSLVQNQGNGNYTISELDVSSIISTYCPTGTNFAGWAISIIYEDSSLPLNQLNVYDGLQSVPNILSIILDNLNVLDNNNAKIGFIAWEGDNALAVNEQLTINGTLIGNPPLNPANNAFNGTNSFTGATNLYNMDIDFYNIQNNINIGDNTATIQLTSGRDFVMINNVITVLNSQLPDASIVLNDYIVNCGQRDVQLNYTVNNLNSTDILPANTPIAFYADTILIGQSFTTNPIGINNFESNTIIVTIPETVGDNFIITMVVDDDGLGNGSIIETNEDNNSFQNQIELLIIPPIQTLNAVTECDEGFNSTSFDLEDIIQNALPLNTSQNITFYTSIDDLNQNENEIFDSFSFTNTESPQTIYVKIENNICYDIFQFNILVENCPPRVPQGFSPNNDPYNDWFNIQGLYNIFDKHKLLIYNRLGALIFEGNNQTPWIGKANRGINNTGQILPVGTYFYILFLNDPNYKPMKGWVYLNK